MFKLGQRMSYVRRLRSISGTYVIVSPNGTAKASRMTFLCKRFQLPAHFTQYCLGLGWVQSTQFFCEKHHAHNTMTIHSNFHRAECVRHALITGNVSKHIIYSLLVVVAAVSNDKQCARLTAHFRTRSAFRDQHNN